METRKDAIDFCLSFPNAFEDYPFHDDNWTVMRHKDNKKTFACIYERNGKIWINVKGAPDWCEFWRNAFNSVIPAYHMNKTHWNSIILDGTVPDDNIMGMINDSYNLTMKRKSARGIKS